MAIIFSPFCFDKLISEKKNSGKYSFFQLIHEKESYGDFPGGTVVKNLPANAGDTGSSPGPGRSHMPRSN